MTLCVTTELLVSICASLIIHLDCCNCGSVGERLPVLTWLSNKYINAFVSSADSGRSNSIYKLVNTNRRRCMTESSLQMLVFLYLFSKVTAFVILLLDKIHRPITNSVTEHKVTDCDSCAFSAIPRAVIKSTAEVQQQIMEFSEKTDMQWVVRSMVHLMQCWTSGLLNRLHVPAFKIPQRHTAQQSIDVKNVKEKYQDVFANVSKHNYAYNMW